MFSSQESLLYRQPLFVMVVVCLQKRPLHVILMHLGEADESTGARLLLTWQNCFLSRFKIIGSGENIFSFCRLYKITSKAFKVFIKGRFVVVRGQRRSARCHLHQSEEFP